MATEVAGLVLGTASLYSIYEACSKGYRLLCTTNCIGADAPLIRAKLIIEEQRFLMWGSIQLVVDGGDASDRPNWNANNLLRSPAIEKAVRETLLAIKLNSETLYAIFEKYGFYKLDEATSLVPKITTEPGPISAALNRRTKSQTFQQRVNRRKSSGDSLRRRMSWGKRMGFALGDKEKIDKCLLDFAHFNKSLYRFTMSAHQASLAQAAIVTQLTQPYILRTPHARIDALRSYREAARSGSYLAIYIEAQHKASELDTELENENRSVYRTMVSGARVKFHRNNISKDNEGEENRRVLVEWKSYSTALEPKVVDDLMKRVDNLVECLRSFPKRSQYHLLYPLGFFEDTDLTDNTNQAWLGIVYELPETAQPAVPVKSLRSLIKTEEERNADGSSPVQIPNLGDRFQLALKLAEFCLHIHSSGWLHKGLRSENVIFFPECDDISSFLKSIERPYVMGFEHSRKEGAREITESLISAKPGVTIYCHPAHLRKEPYRQQFDHYQLGCMLLEIGRWRLLESYWSLEPHISNEMWRKRLISIAKTSGGDMGQIYMDVVVALLEGLDSDDLGRNFYFGIVKQLEKCNA